MTAGTQRDAANVRRAFRKVAEAAGLPPDEWTPRELRHSFVSLLSDAGLPLEQIARLVGHSGTAVTEAVFRKQIRPVLVEGAETMDRIFVRPAQSADGRTETSAEAGERSYSRSYSPTSEAPPSGLERASDLRRGGGVVRRGGGVVRQDIGDTSLKTSATPAQDR